jgi:hypothetical protein
MLNNMQKQLLDSCPRTRFELLSMQADFDLSLGGPVYGTWMNTRTSILGFIHVNGYVLLVWIYVLSFLAQINTLYEYRECKKDGGKYDFFERPCSARWLEYSFTSPCMITIISCCFLIRDVYTTLLIATAQGALVQFGFALECAFELRVLDYAEDLDPPVNPGVAFKPLSMLPLSFLQLQSRINPRISQQLWYWSWIPAVFLHVVIWGVLISSYIENANLVCTNNERTMPELVKYILFFQAFLFSSFGFVAWLQSWNLDVIPFRRYAKEDVTQTNVKESFVHTFFWYTFLSLTAKTLLGVMYMAFVQTFPFYTPA